MSIYFSQNNEQQIIANYFGNFKGTFADIGANNGVTLSNTYALSLAGWYGLCVEPAPSAFDRLEMATKKNSVTENRRNLAIPVTFKKPCLRAANSQGNTPAASDKHEIKTKCLDCQ